VTAIAIAFADHLLNMASETESSSVATMLRLRLKEMTKQKEEHMVSEFRLIWPWLGERSHAHVCCDS
jgi:DNA topoisomerase VI subunit B